MNYVESIPGRIGGRSQGFPHPLEKGRRANILNEDTLLAYATGTVSDVHWVRFLERLSRIGRPLYGGAKLIRMMAIVGLHAISLTLPG